MQIATPRKDIPVVIAVRSRQLAEVYERFFRISGLKVVGTFVDGDSMLSGFKVISAAHEKFVLILDRKLCDDGRTLERAVELRHTNPNLKIIIATSQDLSEVRVDDNAFDALIEKPFTLSELLAKIEELDSPPRIKGGRVFSDLGGSMA